MSVDVDDQWRYSSRRKMTHGVIDVCRERQNETKYRDRDASNSGHWKTMTNMMTNVKTNMTNVMTLVMTIVMTIVITIVTT